MRKGYCFRCNKPNQQHIITHSSARVPVIHTLWLPWKWEKKNIEPLYFWRHSTSHDIDMNSTAVNPFSYFPWFICVNRDLQDDRPFCVYKKTLFKHTNIQKYCRSFITHSSLNDLLKKKRITNMELFLLL